MRCLFRATIDFILQRYVYVVSGALSQHSIFLTMSLRLGINFAAYDIYSTYQPDSIKYMRVDGVDYIVTANEGDDMSLSAGGNSWKEAQRGEDFVDGRNSKIPLLPKENLFSHCCCPYRPI